MFNIFRIPAGKPPRFPKKPTIKQDEDPVSEEMLLIMECILEANPSPEIRWYRGDTFIEESSSRHKMARKKTGRDQYTLTLTIRAPTQEDGGQYRCNAVNTFGESNANIALNFAGKISQKCKTFKKCFRAHIYIIESMFIINV